MFTKITELEEGTIAKIVSIENDLLILKFMEMGLIPGEIIRIRSINPLGGPISLDLLGYKLSLRVDEAESIIAEKIN
jgi:ferrous iron transport protein A